MPRKSGLSSPSSSSPLFAAGFFDFLVCLIALFCEVFGTILHLGSLINNKDLTVDSKRAFPRGTNLFQVGYLLDESSPSP